MGYHKYNYLAFAITNWHLVGARAGCEYLRKQGIEVRPLYIMVSHPQQGFLNLDVHGLNYCKIDIKKGINYLSLIELLFCVFFSSKRGETQYIGLPWAINVKLLATVCKSRNFKCIIYEEGAKSYNMKYHSILYLWKNLKIPQFLNQTLAIILQKIIAKQGNLIDIHPLHRIGSKLVVNEETSALYKQVLDVKPLSLKDDTILIVMQSLEPEYMRVLNIIIPLLLQNNKTIYIKEHPRFPLSKLDFKEVILIKDNRSLEVLMPEIKAKYILSFFSTALITTRMFYNSVPISLYQLMDREKLSSEVDDLLWWFKSTFCKIVNYPKNTEELLKILAGYGEK